MQLWYALGKTMAEKAAWRAARGRDLKLVTLCPGLVTGPGFRRRNSTASIAYLKGNLIKWLRSVTIISQFPNFFLQLTIFSHDQFTFWDLILEGINSCTDLDLDS